MPYHVIAVVAAVFLGILYLANPDASLRSKLAVVTLVAASLIVGGWYPRWLVVATVVQSGVGVYVLLFLKLNEYDA